MKVYRFYDPVYGVSYAVVVCERERMQAWVEAEHGPGAPEPNGGANTYTIEGGDDGAHVAFWFPPGQALDEIATQGLVAHECLHAGLFTLRYVGLVLTEESEEALTYYVNWLYQHVMVGLGARKTRKGRRVV